MSTTITAFPLPTPPFTPAVSVSATTHPNILLLDTLITHYQRERMWVKQTQDLITQARLQQYMGSVHTTKNESSRIDGSTPLWMRRKTCRRLRLSDLTQNKLSKRLLMHDANGSKVLDLFATLLDSRIESCKRMEALIAQSAHSRLLGLQ